MLKYRPSKRTYLNKNLKKFKRKVTVLISPFRSLNFPTYVCENGGRLPSK
jgi:hypothetical protein